MFRFRRKLVSWEVDRCQTVQLTPTWLEDDELDVRDISNHDSAVLIRFDLTTDVYNEVGQFRRNALIHARKQLLRVIAESDKRHNMLLSEGWTVTTLRNGKAKRLQVQYRGRSAYTSGEVKPRNPPFLNVLESER